MGCLIEARTGSVRVEYSFPPPDPSLNTTSTTPNPPDLANPSNSSTVTPATDQDRLRFLKPDFSEHFKHLAFIGDDKLNNLSRHIALSLFGPSNRKLAKKVQDDWLSNDNWLYLSIVYRLDSFVGLTFQHTTPYPIIYDLEKPLITGKQRTTERFAFLKSWADLWEAYFGGLIQEREMWGLDMLDLERFLRRLMIRKYRRLLPCVMNYHVHHTLSPHPVGMSLEELAKGFVTKVVMRTDRVVEAVWKGKELWRR